jgi:putative SOS response-associated peptidase YedK
MCFHSKLSADAQSIQNRFKAKFTKPDYRPTDRYVGFAHPETPIITRQAPASIDYFQWGLVPTWSKDMGIQAYTLNARIETLEEKPSFKDSINKRCLILVDGFYEWQWLTPSGSRKQQYLIGIENDEPFALAGIYNTCKHPLNGTDLHTYSIVTTEALGLMAEIHNSKHRMPVILNPETEQAWLAGEPILNFTKPVTPIIARPV